MESDEELVVAHIEGQADAFTRLVERHLSVVYSYSVRFAGVSDAEDITQETFLKAWKKINTFAPARASFKTWLMRIARNTAIDYMRRRKAVPLSYFDYADNGSVYEIEDESMRADDVASSALNSIQIARALEQLSLAEREIISLYYDGGLTLVEVAEILCIPVNTAKSRFRRAVIALRAILHPRIS